MYLLQNHRGELHEPGTCAHIIENYAGRPICFIDIGAHLGFFSAFAAHLCPENTVYAFEPNPDSFRVLQKNFELNQIRGDICALALSDEVAKVPFKGRSMKVSADDAEMMVDTDRFDLWCERHAIKADVIKIDVHGSEGKVLFGMQETLRHGNLGLYIRGASPALALRLLAEGCHRPRAGQWIRNGGDRNLSHGERVSAAPGGHGCTAPLD
jgi:FkbM family methyltransferase